MCPYVETRFKIALTVYTFLLLLEEEDVLYFIFCAKNIDLKFRRLIGPV